MIAARIRIAFLTSLAKGYVRDGSPIPLDLYAKLDAAGVDITELERNARNG